MKKITSANYQKDTLYPAVARAIAGIMQAGEIVTPVEVLRRLERISQEQYEDWRFGRIAYLERVFSGSLGKASRILRIVDFHARSLGLTPSRTEYRQWGKKGRNRRIVLRFSRSGEPSLEAAYATHYLTKAQQQRQQTKVPCEGESRLARPEVKEKQHGESSGPKVARVCHE